MLILPSPSGHCSCRPTLSWPCRSFRTILPQKNRLPHFHVPISRASQHLWTARGTCGTSQPTWQSCPRHRQPPWVTVTTGHVHRAIRPQPSGLDTRDDDITRSCNMLPCGGPAVCPGGRPSAQGAQGLVSPQMLSPESPSALSPLSNAKPVLIQHRSPQGPPEPHSDLPSDSRMHSAIHQEQDHPGSCP